MNKKQFFNSVARGDIDLVQILLDLLAQTETAYCVIGGLAVNAYVEPLVSLDLDLVVVTTKLQGLCEAAVAVGFKVQEFEHSINLSLSGSDLRIQLQTDPRYQSFIRKSELKDVLGYPLSVAAIEDVLQGKILACKDEKRRPGKRQKDIADIFRIVEEYPHLKDILPLELRNRLD
jgi:hypothetical protein